MDKNSMIPYLILLSLILVLAMIFEIKLGTNNIKRNKRILLVFFLILFAFSTLRAETVCVDYYWYNHIFKDVGSLDMISLLNYPDTEIGYVLLNKIIFSINGNLNTIFLIVSALYLSSFYLFIKKYSKNYFLSFLIFLCFDFFIFSFGLLRQALAISFIVFSIPCITNKKPLQFIVFVLAGSLFHKTSLLFAFAYLTNYIKINKISLSIIIIAAICSLIFSEQIVSFVSNNIYHNIGFFVEEKNTGGYLYLLLLSLTSLFYISTNYNSLKNTNKDQDHFLFKLILISILFQSLSTYFGTLHRVTIIYATALIPLIANETEIIKNKKLKYTIQSSAIVSLPLFYIYKVLISDNNYKPYEISINPIIWIITTIVLLFTLLKIIEIFKEKRKQRNSTKKILQISGSMNMGGQETFIMNIYRNMDREKIKFDFITSECKENYFEKEINNLGGTIYRVPGISKHPIKRFFVLRKIMKKGDYDAIHRHTAESIVFLDLLAAWSCGIKMRISHSHNTKSDHKKIHKLFIPFLNLLSTDKLACSKKAGVWLYGKKTNFITIPNGIKVEDYLFSDDKRTAVRKKFNIKKDELLLGNIGAFRPQKNQLWLIDFFEKYNHSVNANSKLMICGDGELKNQILNSIEQKELKENVILTGNIETKDYLSAFDILLFPSLFEGTPLTLIEAQANGLPILTNNTVDKKTDMSGKIYFLQLNDNNEWLKCLTRHSFIDKERRCPDSIKRTYSIENTVKKIMRLYGHQGI